MNKALIVLAKKIYSRTPENAIKIINLAYTETNDWAPPADWIQYAGDNKERRRVGMVWTENTPPGYDPSYRSFLKWYQQARVNEAAKNPPHLSPGEVVTLILMGDKGTV